MEYLTIIWGWLGTYSAELGGGAAVLAVIEFVFAPVRQLAGRGRQPEKVEVINPEAPGGGSDTISPKLSVAQFLKIRRQIKAELEAELATAQAGDKAQLIARIGELESQIADPDTALAAAQAQITDLEALLQRSGNDIGGDRISQAREAMERGDYSIADETFAEIEERRAPEVQETARAAFGRGEIAEADVRWGDAADHYARAARLDPNYQHLFSARQFASRSGNYPAALRLGEDLLALARIDDDQKNLATALNDHALSLQVTGRYDEAEPLYREALEIGRKTIGTQHPNYSARLGNLAGLLQTTGRKEEAEPLFREALKIAFKTLGTQHPKYATHFSNLAVFLYGMGQNKEAEPLFREALEIDRKTIGTQHPNYALDLNNLAALLKATGRNGEAEPLYREALEVLEAALGAAHPVRKIVQENLQEILAEKPD